MWNIINDDKINFINTNPSDLTIGDIYIVIYENENYRAKLTSIFHSPREKYRVKY